MPFSSAPWGRASVRAGFGRGAAAGARRRREAFWCSQGAGWDRSRHTGRSVRCGGRTLRRWQDDALAAACRAFCGEQRQHRNRRARVDGLQSRVRVLFQDARLLPWQRVLQNAGIGRGHEWRRRAKAVLDDVGLGDRARDCPAVLSGGRRQRAALPGQLWVVQYIKQGDRHGRQPLASARASTSTKRARRAWAARKLMRPCPGAAPIACRIGARPSAVSLLPASCRAAVRPVEPSCGKCVRSSGRAR